MEPYQKEEKTHLINRMKKLTANIHVKEVSLIISLNIKDCAALLCTF
jgi:hypothetical protein